MTARSRLEPADIDAVARRVLALMHDELKRTPVRYVDAGTLANALGVERAWVYAHAKELRAVRLGGARGRLRFDLDLVRHVLQGDAPTPPRTRRTSRTKVTNSSADLLPIDP